jgi:hypothetical protein
MACARKDGAVGVAVGVIILSVVCGPAFGRDPVKLVVHPQKASAEAGKYSLLPPQASLREGDAVPLYQQATKLLPDRKNDERVQEYLKMPIGQLPADQVEQVVKAYVESFKCAAQAIKCRDCQWPAEKLENIMRKLSEYRRLAFAVRLWARYEISQENYEGAVLALQTGLGMGRQLAQGPTTAQLLVGNAINSVMFAEVGQFVQTGEAPNLYAALAILPRPFIEVEKVIESDKKTIPSEPPPGMTQAQYESELKQLPARYDQIRVQVKRLDTEIAALQCVEALRSYAVSHGGQLPQTLAEITEVSLPKDPLSGAAFRYQRSGATAVLESASPAGGDAKDATRYEITLKN